LVVGSWISGWENASKGSWGKYNGSEGSWRNMMDLYNFVFSLDPSGPLYFSQDPLDPLYFSQDPLDPSYFL